jgi:RNase P subunit RPR2
MAGLWQSLRNSLFPPRPRTTERREIDRMPIPLCPNCRSRANVRSRSRSDYAVYFECRHCGEQMVLNKPKGSGRI